MSERKKRRPSRQFSVEEKKKIVEEFMESGLTAKKFAPIYGICMETDLPPKNTAIQNLTF